jgi:hypothetical protein
MKKYIGILFILSLMSSCVTQQKPLTITNGKVSDKLGIYIVKSPNISQDDWQNFSLETFQFINDYNLNERKFKLYPSLTDSNSVRIIINENSYVNKGQQVAGVLVTIAGIITPIIMIAKKTRFYVTFSYTPKNEIAISKSLSNDLDPSNKVVPVKINTRHQFQSLEKQKEKQKVAYVSFLYQLINEISIEKTPTSNQTFSNYNSVSAANKSYQNSSDNTNRTTSDYPDKIILNDGKELICRISKEENEIIYYQIIENNKITITEINQSNVKSIKKGSEVIIKK